MPVYNGSNFVTQAIESALAQDYTNLEILVINDGSNDDGATDTIIRSFGSRIKNISKKNEGIAATLNLGIQEMTGEYFSWLSHDDIYLPTRISRQVEILRNSKNNQSVIYGDYDLINDHGEIIGERRVPHEPPERFYFSLFLRFPVHACTALIPKSALVKIGGFNPSWKYLQDTNMWFRLAPEFPFVHVSEKLTQVRLHKDQGTVTRSALGYSEGNRLYIDEMKKLSKQDILRISNLDPFSFYLRCADSFRLKSYYGAAAVAIALAWHSPGYRISSPVQLGLRLLLVYCLENLQIFKHRALALLERKKITQSDASVN